MIIGSTFENNSLHLQGINEEAGGAIYLETSVPIHIANCFIKVRIIQ